MRLSLYLFVFALIITGCKTAKQPQVSQDGKYSEDLAPLRPTVTQSAESTAVDEKNKRTEKTYVDKPQYTKNKQLDAVLDRIDRINLTRKYSGPKREDALNAKKQLTVSFPDLESELQYVQPNFRVKTGKYFTLLEAEKDFEQVRQHFQSAIVVPDKIAIN